MKAQEESRQPRLLWAPALAALGYLLGAEAAFFIGTLSDKIFAPFWPPNTILFCALLLTPVSRWWLILAAVFPAHVLVEVRVGMPAFQLFVAFATNVTCALINAIAVRHFVGGPPWLGDFRKACAYVIITAGIGPAIAAFGGAFVPILSGGENYFLYWAHWYSGNALAGVTFGPIILTWFGDAQRPVLSKSVSRRLEAIAVGLALIVICTIAFGFSKTAASAFLPVLLYLPLPLILWTAIRFGAKGASASILIVTVMLVSHTLHGTGPFLNGDAESNVLSLQLFLTGLSIPVLLLGAVTDELRRAHDTTRKLAGFVLKAQDSERRRIARELHETTGQNLVAGTLLLGKLQSDMPASADETLTQLDNLLQRSVRDLRAVSYLLHPPLLDEAGLPSALNSYVAGFAEPAGLAIDLDIPADFERLPEDTEITLFRVVQEALTNIKRHSGSESAQIRLRRENGIEGDTIVLWVQDSGKRSMPSWSGTVAVVGQALHAPHGGGMGLTGMRERLHQIGGRLEIISARSGTIITATVPAPHSSPSRDGAG